MELCDVKMMFFFSLSETTIWVTFKRQFSVSDVNHAMKKVYLKNVFADDQFVCGFELLDETCIFRNKGNDDFDWKLGQLVSKVIKYSNNSISLCKQYKLSYYV